MKMLDLEQFTMALKMADTLRASITNVSEEQTESFLKGVMYASIHNRDAADRVETLIDQAALSVFLTRSILGLERAGTIGKSESVTDLGDIAPVVAASKQMADMFIAPYVQAPRAFQATADAMLTSLTSVKKPADFSLQDLLGQTPTSAGENTPKGNLWD